MKTKQLTKDTRARIWFLTIWKERHNQEYIEQKLNGYDVYRGQLEMCPTTGRLHYHVLVEHHNAIRFSTLLNKFPGSDIEKAYSANGALYYVGKDETAYPADEPVRFGKGIFSFENDEAPKEQTKFADLYYAVMAGNSVDSLILGSYQAAWHSNKLKAAEEAIRREKWGKTTRNVKVSYIWGVSGAGKTHSIYEKHGFEEVYVVNDYAHPFDSYNGEDVVVLDEFHSQIDFPYLLQLTDKYPLRLKARYNNKQAAYTKIYLISNEPLEKQYSEIQRKKPETWKALKRRINEVVHMATPYVAEN